MFKKGMGIMEQVKAALTSTTSHAPGITGSAVFGVTLVFPEWINELLQSIMLASTIIWIWFQLWARRKEIKLKEKEIGG